MNTQLNFNTQPEATAFGPALIACGRHAAASPSPFASQHSYDQRRDIFQIFPFFWGLWRRNSKKRNRALQSEQRQKIISGKIMIAAPPKKRNKESGKKESDCCGATTRKKFTNKKGCIQFRDNTK